MPSARSTVVGLSDGITGWPDADMMIGDNEQPAEISAISFKYGVDSRLLCRERHVAQSKEHDPGMLSALANDQLAEVAIVCDQHPVFCHRKCENVGIRDARTIVARNELHVVTKGSKIWLQPSV
jgi:hypothetical protein